MKNKLHVGIFKKQVKGKIRYFRVYFGVVNALQCALGMHRYLPNTSCHGLLLLHSLNDFQVLLNNNEVLCYIDIRLMIQMQFKLQQRKVVRYGVCVLNKIELQL